MVSREFIMKCRGKKVHVDFLDEDSGKMVWAEGALMNVDEVVENTKDYGEQIHQFLEIESEEDYDRIPVKKVRKIYLKDEK